MNFRDYLNDSEDNFLSSLVAIKSCQMTRIDLFLPRRFLDEETHHLLSIVAKFFDKVFNWIRLTTFTRLLLVFCIRNKFQKEKISWFPKINSSIVHRFIVCVLGQVPLQALSRLQKYYKQYCNTFPNIIRYTKILEYGFLFHTSIT